MCHNYHRPQDIQVAYFPHWRARYELKGSIILIVLNNYAIFIKTNIMLNILIYNELNS